MVVKNINKLKLNELKNELSKRGLSQTGTKKVLASRLRGALDTSVVEVDEEVLISSPVTDNPSSFTKTFKPCHNNSASKKVNQEIKVLKEKLSSLESALKSLVKANKKLMKEIKSLKDQNNNVSAVTPIEIVENPEVIKETIAVPALQEQTPRKDLVCEVSVSQGTTYISNIPSTKPLGRDNRLSRVFILSDSHGRDYGVHLKSSLKSDKYLVENICRPGANLEVVVADLETITSDFTFGDYVIIIGGSNNSRADKVSRFSIKSIVFTAKRTNVIITSVPYQFSKSRDNDKVNSFIYKFNIIMCNTVNNFCVSQRCDNALYLDFNTILHRSDYVRNGQHLKTHGKLKVCNLLASAINSVESRCRKNILIPVPLVLNVDGINSVEDNASENSADIPNAGDATGEIVSTSKEMELETIPASDATFLAETPTQIKL